MTTATTTVDSKQQQSHWRKSIISCCSGAIAGVVSEVLFYGIDSYKVMLQASNSIRPTSSIFNLFRGAVPIAIMGSGPSFGVFFLCYSPLHDYVTTATNDEPLSVLIASSNTYTHLSQLSLIHI